MKIKNMFALSIIGITLLAGSVFAAQRMVVCEETYKSG